MTRKLRIALIQMACGEDPGKNLEIALKRVEEAAKDGAELICLPELFRTRYFCQTEDQSCFDLAEGIPGESTDALGRIARAKQVVVIAPLFERRAPGIYHNSVAVIDADGSIAGLYRKMHIPDDPGYYEKYFFTPGDLGFKAVQTKVGPVGTLICWDQWYPEAARITALKGAGVLFYPTAIGWHADEKEALGEEQLQAWQIIQRGHAIANGVYVAAVNRVGQEPSPTGKPGTQFWGSSFVCDPFGKIVNQAKQDTEEILLAEVDPGRIETVRRSWPFLRDRRIDAYDGIQARFLDP